MTQTYPTDPLQAVTHPNPYPYYAALRHRAPLGRDEASNLWVAARAQTVNRVLGDERLTVRPASEPVPHAIAGQPAGEVFGRLARMNEGDSHRLARQALVNGLGSIDTTAVFHSASDRAASLIKRFDGSGAALLDALTFALPVRVVAELMGLPADDALEATVRRFVACLSPASSQETLREAHEAALRLQSALHALALDSTPASPLLERIVAGGLTRSAALPNALVSNLLGLFSQTFDATAGLIGNSLVTLVQYRDVAAQLRPARVDIHAFVHEVARFDPPVQNTRRFVRETVEIEGVTLQPGDAVLVVLAAASRDDDVYENADCFIADREHAPLACFGAGRHACPGEAIAKAIAAGVVSALLDSGYDHGNPSLSWAYRPSLNARIPSFKFFDRSPS
ncbi:MAG: cytochrome P450 [Burkholderiales bacterium]|nr:cytochrome P450 [Burkholderiales bacterium]